MPLTKLLEEEKTMKVTQLIGLGETQRKIYEYLKNHEELNDELKESYNLHQKEIELLIKYQKRNNE